MIANRRRVACYAAAADGTAGFLQVDAWTSDAFIHPPTDYDEFVV